MSDFPLDPSLSKLLLFAHEHGGCSTEMLIVVSMLSVPSVFFRPKDREEESDAAREKFFVAESDHLTLLNVYLRAKQYKFDSQWCARHFIHAKGIRKAREVHAQLLDLMKQQKLEPRSCGDSWDAVRRSICSAYFYNSSKIKVLQSIRLCRYVVAHTYVCSLKPFQYAGHWRIRQYAYRYPFRLASIKCIVWSWLHA